MIRIFLWSICLIVRIPGIAQTEETVEKLFERNEQTYDFSEFRDELPHQKIHPVNLNRVTSDELSRIPGFTTQRIQSFLDYRKTYGEIFSFYELATIPGFDSSFVKSVIPYLSINPMPVAPSMTLKNLVTRGEHELYLRYEQIFPRSKGYLIDDTSAGPNKAGYPGDPQRYYFRYTYSYFDRLRIGVAGAKDPGEQFFRGAQSYGMDFYSGFISLTNTGCLKSLIIGNFRAGFGQGLTLGTGLSWGTIPGFSTGDITTGGIKGSMMMSEGNYLRGIAATVKTRQIELTGFISWHKRDGNVISPDSADEQAVTVSSIREDGLHRTPSELMDKDCISELVIGGNINFSGNFFRAGITGYFLKWSGILARPTEPYKKFYSYGNENFNLGFDFQVRLRKIYLFGELSRSRNNGYAWLAGFSTDPDHRVKVICIIRNYQRDYQNLFSNSFGQQNLSSNEQGIYLNVQSNLISWLSVTAYSDFYRFPWLKYRVDSPSYGTEFGLLLTSQLSKNTGISFRYYFNSWMENASPGDMTTRKIITLKRQNLRFQMTWSPFEQLILKCRFEANMTGNETSGRQYGVLFFQDVTTRFIKFPVNIVFRYAYFDIPGYAQRIYTSEPEVLLGYSIQAIYGKGNRLCLLLTGRITRHLGWWIRGSLTKYYDRSVIGSGLDEIKGDSKYDLTVQIMLRL